MAPKVTPGASRESSGAAPRRPRPRAAQRWLPSDLGAESPPGGLQEAFGWSNGGQKRAPRNAQALKHDVVLLVLVGPVYSLCCPLLSYFCFLVLPSSEKLSPVQIYRKWKLN